MKHLRRLLSICLCPPKHGMGDQVDKHELGKSMGDQKKSKAQLLEELEQAHARIAKLESEIAKSLKVANNNFVNRAPRRQLKADIEFIADFDIIQARGINLSETGICFELHGDLPFEMKFDMDGEPHAKRANLVWVRRMPEGGFRFGLKFIPGRPEPEF